MKKPGDEVKAGEPIIVLHADDENLFQNSVKELDKAVIISVKKPQNANLIMDIIE